MADQNNRENDAQSGRPKRAAKQAALSQIDKVPKKTRRVKAPRNNAAAAEAAAPTEVLEIPELPQLDGGQTGCKEVFGALHKYCEEFHEKVILSGRQLQKDAAATVMNLPLHPALPQANIGIDWTQDDEARAQEIWNARKQEWEIIPSTAKAYAKLFRLCLQFGECTPWDIVGTRTKLRFELEGRGQNTAADVVNHMWSYSFCNKLSVLVTHSAWPTDRPLSLANHLAAALQYAVILRTGDGRMWNPAFGSNDQFLVTMKQFSEKMVDGKSMRDVHAAVRAHLRRLGFPLPHFSTSHVFLELEKLVDSPVRPVVAEGEGAYPVCATDLALLIRALDNMATHTGYRQSPADVQYETAMACRPRNYPPSGPAAIERYHTAAMVEEMRRDLLRSRAVAPFPSEADESPERQDTFAPPPPQSIESPEFAEEGDGFFSDGEAPVEGGDTLEVGDSSESMSISVSGCSETPRPPHNAGTMRSPELGTIATPPAHGRHGRHGILEVPETPPS